MRPIVVTTGEPAGIGPDLIVTLAQRRFALPLVVIGDPALLQARAKLLNLPLRLTRYQPHFALPTMAAGDLLILPVSLPEPSQVGQLNAANVSYVLATMKMAADYCLRGEFAAVVTGPVHKGIINESGISFRGQTEFFAACAQCSLPVMMLVHNALRVALLTTHLPLRHVADQVTGSALAATIDILDRELKQRFAIAAPRITVCGLNPHAGEDGFLGREEIDIMIPTLHQLRQQGYLLTGPLPADSAFTPAHIATSDVFLAMYHDQGLPVIKFGGFGEIVNITLGLPFLRTSVDHGTALSLAGTGKASAASFICAIETAINVSLT